MVEFALCAAFLLPLYIWMVIMGLDLKRVMQTNQVSRDAGHMYARWVDFSQPGNQDLIVRLASGLGLTRTGGSGVVILSKMMKIGLAQCSDGGVPEAQCANLNQTVFVQRIVIGNKALQGSRFGTPEDSIVKADGTIDAVNYLKKASAVSSNFGSTLALGDGEVAYVSEAWFQSPVQDFPTTNNRGPVYARSIY
jgi:hypothetical protein